LAVTLIEPLPPAQPGFTAVAVAVNCVGCVTTAVAVEEQLFASRTVTVYVPATRLLALAALDPFDQAYVYTPVPPVAFTVTLPLLPPKQLTAVALGVSANAAGCVIVNVRTTEHPAPSVAVTVYVPAVTPLRFVPFVPFDHA
jgi:hypothetical protein